MVDVRLDKWLWAARFFKTRSAANAAIASGKVTVDGERSKPGREVAVGLTIQIRKPPQEQTVVVRGLSTTRGPGPQAALLYEETPASVAAREELSLQLKQEAALGPRLPKGRPTKRDRRNWLRVRRG